MLRSLALATIAFALTASPVLAAEKAQIPLSKNSKWELNYDDDACHLMARFGEGDQSTTMKLTRTSPGDDFELTLFSQMLKFGGILMPMEIEIGDLPTPYRREGVALTTNSTPKNYAVMIGRIRLDGWDYPRNPKGPFARPNVSVAQEAAVTSLSFKPPGGKWYRLMTGPMDAPMAAMRTCLDDLQRFWGFDPKVEAGLTRRAAPTGNPGSWIGTSDFPNKALMAGNNGYVRFRLDVDAAGQVTGCRILFRTKPDEFADHSCRLLMKRAKFIPALDAAGKPVKSYYISQIRWQSGEW